MIVFQEYATEPAKHHTNIPDAFEKHPSSIFGIPSRPICKFPGVGTHANMQWEYPRQTKSEMILYPFPYFHSTTPNR